MPTNVIFPYSGVYVDSDRLVTTRNSVIDTDPSDRLEWLALDPLLRPATLTCFLSGNDIIYLSGNIANTVDAGAGDDEVRGGNGSDVLSGGAGDDWLSGGNTMISVNTDSNLATAEMTMQMNNINAASLNPWDIGP